MGTKRFRTLRLWHNTLLMVWSVPFMILPGIIVGASTGKFLVLQVMLGLGLIGFIAANRRDHRKKCQYLLEGDLLVLILNDERLELSFHEISDASLIDRAAAREYLRIQTLDMADRVKRVAKFTRFCTVDIGLKSYTMGLGRALTDRLPNAKSDLVLLRLRSGEIMLLSPQRAQEFVEGIGRRMMHL